MSRTHSGRHELGQNFLTDRPTVEHIVALAGRTHGPIIEWGTGDGALTIPLARLGRPIEGIELDPRRAARLQRRVGPHVCISEGDILRHAPPAGCTIVSNVPFHVTTPVLRHLLAATSWHDAILITQWEVARKRAGVGEPPSSPPNGGRGTTSTSTPGFRQRRSHRDRRWTAAS
jgi:23S rRNA (adenine-N6)-dimethyltransferase